MSAQPDGSVCKHGALARVCLSCELEATVADLERQLAEARAEAAGVSKLMQRVHIAEDRALAAEKQLEERTRERDKYHDALIARHGGEPIALLSELDAERASADRLLVVMRELVEALDGAFISSWQSTAAWQKQLEAARETVKKEGE